MSSKKKGRFRFGERSGDRLMQRGIGKINQATLFVTSNYFIAGNGTVQKFCLFIVWLYLFKKYIMLVIFFGSLIWIKD